MYRNELGKIASLPPLDKAEEDRLVREIKKGDKTAKDRLVMHNTRLVISIAAKGWDAIPLEDRVSEGNIGLLEAVDSFEPERGNRFSTHASWKIYGAVTHFVRAESRHKSTLSTREIASLGKIENLKNSGTPNDPEILSKKLGVSPRRIRRIREHNKTAEIISLDAPIYGASGAEPEQATLSEIINNQSAPDPFNEAVLSERRSIIEKAVNSLPPVEADILKYRFGFDGNGGETLEEVGHRLGYTRERIRQIERQALSKLRMRTSIRELT